MPATRILELRLCRVHHGRREEFARRFRDHVLPMFERHGMDIIHHGPSLHDEDSYCMVRAFASLDARQAAIDTFLGGDEWLVEQEEAVLDLVDTMNTSVLAADGALIEALRAGFGRAEAEPDALSLEGGNQSNGD